MWRTLWKLIISEQALSFVSDKLTCGVISGVIWHGELFFGFGSSRKNEPAGKKNCQSICWKLSSIEYLRLLSHNILLIRKKFLQTIFRRKNNNQFPGDTAERFLSLINSCASNEVLFRRNSIFSLIGKIPKRW